MCAVGMYSPVELYFDLGSEYQLTADDCVASYSQDRWVVVRGNLLLAE